jgi:hypothetical protein
MLPGRLLADVLPEQSRLLYLYALFVELAELGHAGRIF